MRQIPTETCQRLIPVKIYMLFCIHYFKENKKRKEKKRIKDPIFFLGGDKKEGGGVVAALALFSSSRKFGHLSSYSTSL